MSVKSDIVMAFAFDYRRKLDNALKRGLVGATGIVRDFGTKLAQELEQEWGNPADSQAEFEKIAEAMRVALIAGYTGRFGHYPGYEEAVEGRKVVPSYRQGAGRYSGGALRRALENKSMAVASPQGISYLNKTLLDDEARHWRRLNFGAQGYRSNASANLRLPVTFDDRVLFYAGSEGGIRPGFSLPPGRFIDPRTGKRVPYGEHAGGETLSLPPTVDRFYPGGGGRAGIRTGGIQARHYIDAGFAVLAEQFGPAIDALYRKWDRQATERVHPISAAVVVE